MLSIPRSLNRRRLQTEAVSAAYSCCHLSQCCAARTRVRVTATASADRLGHAPTTSTKAAARSVVGIPPALRAACGAAGLDTCAGKMLSPLGLTKANSHAHSDHGTHASQDKPAGIRSSDGYCREETRGAPGEGQLLLVLGLALQVLDAVDAVLALALGTVEGHVGTLQQVVRGLSGTGGGDAGGDRQAHHLGVASGRIEQPEAMVLDRSAQHLCALLRHLEIGVGEQDHELVPPVATDTVRIAQRLLQEESDLLDDQVAVVVTVAVVDFLETVCRDRDLHPT